jgi:hypothetical protein
MDVLNGMITEEDMRHYAQDKINALNPLIDDVLAKMLKDYMHNENADKTLVAIMQDVFGNKIDKLIYSMNPDFKEQLEDLNTLSICNITDPDKVLQILQYDSNLITPVIQPRLKSDFDDFVSLFTSPASVRIMKNKLLFFTPHAKQKQTYVYKLCSNGSYYDMLRKAAIFQKQGLKATEFVLWKNYKLV